MDEDFRPLSPEEWPEPVRDLASGFAARLNVYKTMAHRPEWLVAWAPLREHVVVATSLGKSLSEVVILRTGHRMNAPYEWAHHVSRARACGMDDARIRSIAGPLVEMAPQDRVLSAAVDELVEKKALTPASRRAVVERVGKDGLFDLIATVGFYTTLAYIVNSFDTPVDADVAAELAERPL
jgi:4-carboxymuconolactone decarboxylase